MPEHAARYSFRLQEWPRLLLLFAMTDRPRHPLPPWQAKLSLELTDKGTETGVFKDKFSLPIQFQIYHSP